MVLGTACAAKFLINIRVQGSFLFAAQRGTMQEIYLFENTGQISLRPVTADTEVDAQLLQAAQEDNFDWMEPMFAGGDSELVYMTAFRHPQNAGGAVIVISGGGEHMFCVLARTNLDLVSAASHFSSMVSNIRYGLDIFENISGDDD